MLFLWHGNDWKQIAHKIIKSYWKQQAWLKLLGLQIGKLLLLLLLLSRFSRVRLCVTPEMVVQQAPPSLGFSRKAAHIPKSAPGKEMNRLQKFCTPFLGHILQHLHQMCVRRAIKKEETHRVESWGMGEIDTGVHPERTSQPNPRMYYTARSSPLHHDFLLLWIVNCYVFSLLAFLNFFFHSFSLNGERRMLGGKPKAPVLFWQIYQENLVLTGPSQTICWGCIFSKQPEGMK